jgi:Tol biopolymer transport system component
LSDIYLKDRQTGSVTLVSAANGVVGNGGSFDPSVSDDGTVAFVSDATNLAAGATGSFAKILVWSPSGAIARVDVALSGEADGPSTHAQISGDGTTVVFQSDASNLVPEDTNRATDVFVAKACTVTRVSLTQAGVQTNGRSYEATVDYDGGVVAFASDASDILFNDGNQATDVFAVDLQTNDVIPISFATTGFGGSVGSAASSEPSLSGDGRTVAFRSFATNFAGHANGLATIYVNPIRSGRSPTPVSVATSGAPADGASYQSAISYDGSVVAFTSIATNLGSGNSDGAAGVFVHDGTTGETIRVDVGVSGLPADGSALINSSLQFSGSPSVPSPSFLVFDSIADNLVYGDTNGVADVFSASLSP